MPEATRGCPLGIDEDHVPVRHAGECIHFVPRRECRICPDVPTHVLSVPCPGPAEHEMWFGHFYPHIGHAPGAPIFARRELVRSARRQIALRHGRDYPAYLLFDDHALDRFAAFWPHTESVFCGYFGEDNYEAWGCALMALIRDDLGDAK